MTPRHFVLLFAVLGLLAGGWLPLAVPALVVAATLAAPTRAVAGAAVIAVALGAVVAMLRREAIDQGHTPARIGAVVHGEATLLERVRTRASGERVAAARWRGGWADGERLLLKSRGSVQTPAPGTIVSLTGRLAELRPFDQYQRRRGALAAIEVLELRPTGRRRGGLLGGLDTVRSRAERGLDAGVSPEASALTRGMVLGQDDAIEADVRRDFQVSGLAHILAVSGTNVVLLATLVLGAGALIGAPLRWRLGTALLLVGVYVPLAGGGASIQRAGVMGAAGLVAALAGRAASRWYALGLAAAVTLALNPYAAADPGWQLSFAAVIGLIVLAGPIRDRLARRRLPSGVAEAGAMTVAATIATAPLLAVHFGQVSMVSLPANLLAAPLVAPIMWLGMLAAAVAQISVPAAALLSLPAGALATVLARLAHIAAQVPLASIHVPLPVIGALYAIAGAGFLLRRRILAILARAGLRRPGPGLSIGHGFGVSVGRGHLALAAAMVAVLALMLLPGGGPAPPRPGETVVSFLDIGQGDATLVQRDGASLLVDTGPPDGPILQRLEEAGVRRLDVLLTTHAQADHEGAAAEVVRRFRPRLVLDGGAGWPTSVQRSLARVPKQVPVAGETLRLGAMRLKILWPPRELMYAPPEGDPNNRAVVAQLQSGDFDLLLTADAESDVTGPLELPPVEALKVAHHGSEDAGLPALLARLRPSIAAIEVGRRNTYGHPRPSTLAALRVVPRVYRTDRDGTVRLRVLGGRMTVERG